MKRGSTKYNSAQKARNNSHYLLPIAAAACLLVSISIASAAPTLTFQNNETQPGETIIATITTIGNFEKQIEPSDIKFYEGRKQVSFESDIKFYEGTHYLYIYTTREGNFSIEISEILYKEADALQATTITKQFSITEEKIIDEETNETSTQILQIKPGFIFTTETPSIKLINKGTSELSIEYAESEISLQPLETYDIVTIPEQVFSYMKISTYKEFSIPIIYPTANATFVSPSVQLDLRQSPELLLAELLTNTKSQETIELFNFGDEPITEIQITSDFDFIETEEIENMSAREVKNLTLTFDPEFPGHFQGNINITYTQYAEQQTLSIPLSLFILPEGSTTEDFEIINETCAEISGTVCESGFICSGEATFTKNQEYCCLGTCESTGEDESEGGGFGWLIGIIIIIALGFGGYYFYKKQKKVVPKKPEEQIKESSEKYAERLKGAIKPERVKGSITKS